MSGYRRGGAWTRAGVGASHGARFRDRRVAETHIFFLTSTWLSLRSYSFRIFCFSASTTCSFSMLNSCRGWVRGGMARGQIASVAWREKKRARGRTSSAATRISFAFSSASCLMNCTIW